MADKEDIAATPPTPVSFFDPAVKHVRRRVYLQWSRIVGFLALFVLVVLSLYWGVQNDTERKLTHLKVWVVDFDGQTDDSRTSNPIVGPAVINAVPQFANSQESHLGYEIKNASEFNNDVLAVRQAVYDEKAFAAIIVNTNATELLRRAVSQQNTSYDPNGAIQTVVVTARDQSTYGSYVLPGLTNFQHAVLASFGPQWVQNLINNNTNMSSVPPQAINPAIGFTEIDLRPFKPAVAGPAVAIGLIYLIIVAFFNFPFLMPIHAQLIKPSPSNPPVKMSQWLIWRICSNILAYFFMSFFYSLVSLAYGIPFTNSPAPATVSVANANAYGHGSFVVYWMLNWVGMAALGFPCENMAMVLGAPWSALFLIFWVITNVATGFYPLEVANAFYRWGYAWPLHRIVEASRTIMFGTHSRIGLDFGILLAWVGISIAFFPFASFIMRWKMRRGWA
ncbi:Uncharacterized protein PECH_007120 [Penicillium ucsense]|uniref:DUF3533 domain-containing protein n=1 Tax=Penicillium ucsense TaxID=2839758 RepID=A0A8J8W440_9EURO|nr:Uncharacterized protein PECM_006869 [Penicillium ucsense]KAF7735142.1 Uncharacterized protein PECH_007120 [Penicillium ucsense]